MKSSFFFMLGRAALFLCAGVVSLSVASECAWAKGELREKEARNLIRRMGGGELPSGAVRVLSVTPSGPTDAVALAEVETAFRFESDDKERWRVVEIRTGSDRWEDLTLIAQATGGGTVADAGAEGGMIAAARVTGALDGGHAREILASLTDIRLPSDALRVKEISSLYNSTVVVARVTVEFRFKKGSDNRWRLVEFRTGEGDWRDLEKIAHAVNTEKARRARSELEMLATALDAFRRERGFFVVADSTGVLVDQLNPRYLARVVRLDPWHRPYLYEGERDRYRLLSAGPDGEPGTGDDINVAGHGNTGN
ncbi:MAG TPA: type II secretion system protein GspG [Pyrinomonadaceae bacterium]|jgi:hypothetical protein